MAILSDELKAQFKNDRLLQELKNQLAQEHHWAEQERSWEAERAHRAEMERHWRAQRWLLFGSLSVAALTLAAKALGLW